MKLEEIKDLMQFLEKGSLHKIVIKKGDFELQLEKAPPCRVEAMPAPSVHHAAPAKQEAAEDHKAAKPATAAKPGKYVTSPMVGTFYSSAAPDQPPFVKVGDRVQENTVVCIIEAMKVMNEVKAGAAGVVAEIMVDNTRPVEFGTKIMRIV